MGWQDSFVPDPQAAQPAPQPSGNWMSSFVPDGTTTPDKPVQFANPITAAGQALHDMIQPMSDMGAMTYGSNPFEDAGANRKPITPGDWGTYQGTKENAGNIASLLMPFLMPDEDLTQNVVTEARTPNLPDGVVMPRGGDIKLIKDKLEMAGVTPQQFADALKNSSPDDFAGELGGDPLRMQTQAQAKLTGPAMQAARDAMRQRLSEAPQRTQAIIDQSFTPQPTIEGMQQNISDMEDKLPSLYRAADPVMVPRSVGIDAVNTPAGQTAMKQLVVNFKNNGINPTEAGVVIGGNGFHGLAPEVPVSTLDAFQKSLGDQVERDPLTNKISDHASDVVEGMRKGITASLAKASPEYASALNTAAAEQQAKAAMALGRKLAGSSAGERADAITERAESTFSPNELSFHKAGYAQGLSDQLQGVPSATGNPAARLTKPAVTTASGDVLQSPVKAQQFAEALLREKNRVELAQRGLFGSNTAETLSAGEVPSIPHSPDGLVSKVVHKVVDMATAGKNARIAQLLYATSPEQKALLAERVLK